MNRSCILSLLLLVLVVPGLWSEEPGSTLETQLFITGQTDETGEVYGAATDEVGLRPFLTEKGVAAFVNLEVKDGLATGTMRLLRKDDNGSFAVYKLRFTELMSLSLSWKVSGPQDVGSLSMASTHVHSFMQLAKNFLVKPTTK
jgi:hypothetical protein